MAPQRLIVLPDEDRDPPIEPQEETEQRAYRIEKIQQRLEVLEEQAEWHWVQLVFHFTRA